MTNFFEQKMYEDLRYEQWEIENEFGLKSQATWLTNNIIQVLTPSHTKENLDTMKFCGYKLLQKDTLYNQGGTIQLIFERVD